jgi:hypothetical protein
MHKVSYQDLIQRINPSQVELIQVTQENTIDAITLVTLDSESIDGITDKRKNIIIQYHQLRRQITNEFKALNISQFPEDSSIMQTEFYFNTQLESINSGQIYKYSGMNHSASNTTTNTAAGTTNKTNETSN